MSLDPVIFPNFPRAACIGHADLFDARARREEPWRTAYQVITRHRRAKEICGLCPHLQECRDWALRNYADVPLHRGPVLGGLTDFERIHMRQKLGMPTPADAPTDAIRRALRRGGAA